jgi:tetratricopeptide (TPR) repeat protein
LAESLACADFQGALLRDDAVTEARQAAATAIRLNGNLAPAHAALGYVKMIHDWDWNGAEVEFREAVRLDPSLPEAHTWYAKDLLITGRFDGALEQFRLAVPDPRLAASSLAQVLCGAHRYDEGIADARRGAEAFPGSVDAAISLGICLDAKGNHSEAIDAFQSAAARSPSTYALARLAQAEAANGDHKAAESILREIQRKAASDMGHEWTHIAMILASLGEVAQAVDSLERAVQWREPDVMFMGVDPVFDGIRSDARFTGLRKRLGLP